MEPVPVNAGRPRFQKEVAPVRESVAEVVVEPQWHEALELVFDACKKAQLARKPKIGSDEVDRLNTTADLMVSELEAILNCAANSPGRDDLLHALKKFATRDSVRPGLSKISARSVRLTVLDVSIDIATLGDFVGLWAAAAGYAAYFSPEWWKANDVHLYVVFFVWRLWNHSKRVFRPGQMPSDLADYILYENDRIKASSDAKHLWTKHEAKLCVPKNKVCATVQLYGDTPEAAVAHVFHRLAEIIRTRNYRCLHPMIRKAFYLSDESLSMATINHDGTLRTRAVKRPSGPQNVQTMVRGRGPYRGFSNVSTNNENEETEARKVRALFHGSALMQLITGLPDLNPTRTFANQDKEALREGLNGFGPVLENVSKFISPSLSTHWRTNMRNACSWAQSQETEGVMKSVTHMFVKFSNMVDTLAIEDAYVVLARMCFERIMASGLCGVGPETRLLALLYYVLYVESNPGYLTSLKNVLHLLPEAKDALQMLLEPMHLDAYLRDIVYDTMVTGGFFESSRGGARTENERTPKSNSSPYVSGATTPLSEYAFRGAQLLFDSQMTLRRDRLPVSEEWEYEVVNVGIATPAFVQAFYVAPHAAADAKHAVQHFDYALAAINGAALWSAAEFSTNTMLDVHSDFQALLRTMQKHSARSSRRRNAGNAPRYIHGLSLDVATLAATGQIVEPHAVPHAFSECARHRWSVLDLARLVFLEHSDEPHEFCGEPQARTGIVSETAGRPLALQHRTVARVILCERIDALAQAADALGDRLLKDTTEHVPSLAEVMAVFVLQSVTSFVFYEWQAITPDSEEQFEFIAVCTVAFAALKRLRNIPSLRKHVQSLKLIVNDARFTDQARATGFCGSYFPGAPHNAASHGPRAESIAISQHANALLGFRIALSRMSRIRASPSFVGSYMDTMIIPLIVRMRVSLDAGRDRFFAPTVLQNPSRNTAEAHAHEDWNGINSSWKPPRDDVSGALFLPSPAFFAPTYVSKHHARIDMPIVLPDTTVIPFTNYVGAAHLLEGSRCNVGAWKIYAPRLADLHFLAAPRMIRRTLKSDDNKLTQCMNHFDDSVDHETATKQCYCLDDDSLFGNVSSHLRSFYDTVFPPPDMEKDSLAFEIAHTDPDLVDSQVDFAPLYASPQVDARNPLIGIMNRAAELNRVHIAQGKTHTYYTFNALLRGVFKRDWLRRCNVSPGKKLQPIEYDTPTEREIDVAFYKGIGLVIAVPDVIMDYLLQFVISEQQQEFFIYEHMMLALSSYAYRKFCRRRETESTTNLTNYRSSTKQPRNVHCAQKRLLTHNHNLLSMQQLIQMGVIANTPQNRYKIAHNTGIVSAEIFVPSALAHFSKEELSIDSQEGAGFGSFARVF